MKISVNLLRELIDFEWSAERLVENLTMSGSEVEAVEQKGNDIQGILAAKVIEVAKIEGSDKLTCCTVFDGREKIDVVCGAPNVAHDQVVLFAPVDSRIPGSTLEKAKIAGKESAGMILSEAELQLSENAGEIAVLPDDIKPGTPLEKIVDYKDTILQLEITPNRPDCLSHIGIAREVQALGGGKLKMPDVKLAESDIPASGAVKIVIDNPRGCPRYTGRVIRNVKIGPSPLWLKMMVYYLDMRPINNVVDITNYVMLELGHPLHAFDFDLFKKPEVVVRNASDGEKFITLDEVERTLNSNHLLITDSVSGVAVAGIMGGELSEVSEKTSNILLESAYFDPVIIRRGSKALGLATESSRRFERGADPEMAPFANNRACKLISEIAGGENLSGVVDAYPAPLVPVEIDFKPENINSLLGTKLSANAMCDILKGLDIDTRNGDSYKAIQPSFRPDLTREVDLSEEIARIHGFENIPPVFRPGGALGAEETKLQRLTRDIESYLTGAGGTEVFSLTLVDSNLTRRLGLLESSVTVMNPLSEELAAVRPSLLLSMLPVLRRNINFKERDLFLYELGDIYLPSDQEELPLQQIRLAIGLSGYEAPVFWGEKQRKIDFFTIKGLVENLADYLKLGTINLRPEPHFAFDKSRSFVVYINDNNIGYLGSLSEECLKIADIKEEVLFAEFDMQKIESLVPDSLAAKEVDRFPSADRDIAIVIDENIGAEEIRSEIINSSVGFADDVRIFDLYHGKNIPESKKSLAFSIKYRLPDRTLTDEEVDDVHGKIADVLKMKFGAELRS
ncbi:MAG: phenylalanine--tRNA ligase subunit beta [Candidatus Zixiibacteriota bacterium]|nr:MAG: phenylalanine--tRNA ligase subunit beta [candidate division Zixibacteria bacterium]